MTVDHPAPHPHFLFQTLLSQFYDFPFFLFFFIPCRPKPEPKPKLTHFLSVWLSAFTLTGAAICSPREQQLNTYVWGLGQDQYQCPLCLHVFPPGTDPGSQTKGASGPALTCGCGWHFSVWLLIFAFCVFKADNIVVFLLSVLQYWYWLQSSGHGKWFLLHIL